MSVALVLAIALGVGSLIVQGRNNAIDNWRERTASLTNLLAAHAELIFDGIFDSLDSIAADLHDRDFRDNETFRQEVGSRDMHTALRRLASGARRVLYVGIADAEGQVVGMTRRHPPLAMYIGDRDYFRACITGKPDMRVIGAPVENRLDQVAVIPLCVPLRNRSGKVIGAAFGGIATSYFIEFYKSNSFTRDSEIRMLRKDGLILASYGSRADASLAGKSAPDSLLLTNPDELKSGIWTSARGAATGHTDPRVIAAVQIDDLPLIVGATIFGSVALKEWLWQAQALSSVSALLCLLILIFGFSGGRFMRRQQALIVQQKQAVLQEMRAKEAAEKSEKSKLNFISFISHDLRTPLTSLIASVELINDAQPEAEKRKYFNLIRASSQQLLSLIDSILNFTTSDLVARRPRAEVFSLCALLDEQAQIGKATAVGKPLDFEVSCSVGLSENFVGYPGIIGQILMNLLGNAIKYTPSGKIVVSAVLASENDTAKQALISVTDTGPGIPKELQSRLFQPFVRGAANETRDVKGYGLGLSIAARLARSIGATLTVESEPGKGATFTLGLPLHRLTPGDEAAQAQPPEPSGEARRLNILIAEDTPSINIVLRALLKKLGHSVTAVTNGQEAVEAAAADAYDLAFMDLQMPVMDGYEAIRRIHELPGRENMPVVVLTGFSEEVEAVRLAVADIRVYLRKPVKLADLSAAIDRAMSGAPLELNLGPPGRSGGPG